MKELRRTSFHNERTGSALLLSPPSSAFLLAQRRYDRNTLSSPLAATQGRSSIKAETLPVEVKGEAEGEQSKEEAEGEEESSYSNTKRRRSSSLSYLHELLSITTDRPLSQQPSPPPQPQQQLQRSRRRRRNSDSASPSSSSSSYESHHKKGRSESVGTASFSALCPHSSSSTVSSSLSPFASPSSSFSMSSFSASSLALSSASSFSSASSSESSMFSFQQHQPCSLASIVDRSSSSSPSSSTSMKATEPSAPPLYLLPPPPAGKPLYAFSLFNRDQAPTIEENARHLPGKDNTAEWLSILCFRGLCAMAWLLPVAFTLSVYLTLLGGQAPPLSLPFISASTSSFTSTISSTSSQSIIDYIQRQHQLLLQQVKNEEQEKENGRNIRTCEEMELNSRLRRLLMDRAGLYECGYCDTKYMAKDELLSALSTDVGLSTNSSSYSLLRRCYEEAVQELLSGSPTKSNYNINNHLFSSSSSGIRALSISSTAPHPYQQTERTKEEVVLETVLLYSEEVILPFGCRLRLMLLRTLSSLPPLLPVMVVVGVVGATALLFFLSRLPSSSSSSRRKRQSVEVLSR
ncbi:hypothetical protein QOT17_022837 [Balamuthia mandrillaris]